MAIQHAVVGSGKRFHAGIGQQLQQAALRTAQLDTTSTTQLRARLHLAPLLPSLRVTLGRGWQVAYSGRTQDGLTEPTVDGDRFSYAVTAHWDLAKLLVPHEELSLFRDQPRRAQRQRRRSDGPVESRGRRRRRSLPCRTC